MIFLKLIKHFLTLKLKLTNKNFFALLASLYYCRNQGIFCLHTFQFLTLVISIKKFNFLIILKYFVYTRF